MIVASILLFADFVLLALVFYFYFRRALRERRHLQKAADEGLELQQKIYQIQVLQEIGDRLHLSRERVRPASRLPGRTRWR